jgi:hypothetical protein
VRLYKENEIKTINLEITLKERDEAYRQIDEAYAEALNRLAHMAELRDEETGAHIKRVGYILRCLLKRRAWTINSRNLFPMQLRCMTPVKSESQTIFFLKGAPWMRKNGK